MKRNVMFAVSALSVGIMTAVVVLAYHYFYPEKYVQMKDGTYQNIVTAQKQSPFPVTQETTFLIEYYYKDEDRTLKENVGNIPALLGCDKEDVEAYLHGYMQQLSREEQEKGLCSYTMVSYGGNTISLRKVYEKPVYHGFYAKCFNGYVVILNGDEKTVYEYTQILIHLLPEDIREKVSTGYFLENESDLFNFLETYSS